MKSPTPDSTRAPATAARRFTPMLISLLLAACAHEPSQQGTGNVPAAASSGASANGAAANAADEAGSASASAAWPPHLREWSQKARDAYGVPTLGAAEAAMLPDEVVIVDVREAREVQVSGLPRAMALTSEQTRSEFARQARGELVLVYCTVGWRSAQYTQQLVKSGVKAFNLDGGLCAWAAAGQPIVDPQGKPTTAIHPYSKDFADCVPPGFVAVTE